MSYCGGPPDIGIDDPQMRAEWAGGQREAFWPHGKTMAEVFSEEA